MGLKIALAGNPNCGKTTMFNFLTGSSQYVGNWPGVTVEKKEGKLKGHKEVLITDLPGIYSLSPYTLEEVVSRDYLINEKPDAVINLVDGTNLERNLYLTTQIMELGIPVVIALNMMDLISKSGNRIDTRRLSSILGCEVVETSALKGTGVMEAAERAITLAKEKRIPAPYSFRQSLEQALSRISCQLEGKVDSDQIRWFSIKLFERDEKVMAHLDLPKDTKNNIHTITSETEKVLDDDSESIITDERYRYISQVINKCLQKSRGR